MKNIHFITYTFKKKKGNQDDVQSVEEQFLCGIYTPDFLEGEPEQKTENDGKFCIVLLVTA